MRAEEVMRHDWVFDVLSDLLAYARQNGLPGLATRVAQAIEEARQEIATRNTSDDTTQPPPPTDRRMN
jgi:hypothetical protein